MSKARARCGGIHEIISLAPRQAPTAATSRGELPPGQAREIQDFVCAHPGPGGIWLRHVPPPAVSRTFVEQLRGDGVAQWVLDRLERSGLIDEAR
jgi:hypothetical protein